LPNDQEYIDDSAYYQNILTIIHLDDHFIQGRINTISNLTQLPTLKTDEILNQLVHNENGDYSPDFKIIKEGTHEIITLVKRIKERITRFTLQNPDPKIYLLNFLNSSNSKTIYKPYEDKIIEVENWGFVSEKNFQQTKTFILKLFDDGILPYTKINLELVGVYRYACVNNINSHLAHLIQEGELPIKHSINYSLTV
jgi:hypothetical protein